MLLSSSSIISVLFVFVIFSQDVDAGMSRRRHVPGRAGLQSHKAHRATAVMVRSVESDQSSLLLNLSQIGANTALNGRGPPVVGQVPSLTSTNNYINFCATQNVPLTNGTQLKPGSCNQTPMGRIIATNVMPSGKFAFPFNGDALQTNTTFTIKLNLRNLNAGHFSNPTVTYYAKPQTVDNNGVVIGHAHVVIEKIPCFTTTDLPKPTNFAYFKGVDGAADKNGQVTANASGKWVFSGGSTFLRISRHR